MGIDDGTPTKHTNIQRPEDDHQGSVYMGGIDQDTETVATDEEIKEIEILARSRGVFHWAGIIRIINRLRRAEKEQPPVDRSQTGGHGE